MPRKNLQFPEDVGRFVQKKFINGQQGWLAAPAEGSWPLTMLLGEVTEQVALQELATVRAWVDAWRQYEGPGQLNWEERQWSKLGTQRLPVRISFGSPEEIARAADEGERWSQAVFRYSLLADRHPGLAKDTLAKQFTPLADYSAEEFRKLVALVDWFAVNPESGLYLRQLPIEGLDTKWLESRKLLVMSMVHALHPQKLPTADFHDLLGLTRMPYRMRMRVLCPKLRSRIGGLGDFEAPSTELVELPIIPRTLIIVENLETGVALPDLPGAVVFMKLGHAIDALAALPWLSAIPRAFYWGDIDTHGFVILDRARRILPRLTSVMMDEVTLLEHRSLWGEEPVQSSAARLSTLNRAELGVFEGLRSHRWGPKLRLEQERLPWPRVLAKLREAML